MLFMLLMKRKTEWGEQKKKNVGVQRPVTYIAKQHLGTVMRRKRTREKEGREEEVKVRIALHVTEEEKDGSEKESRLMRCAETKITSPS